VSELRRELRGIIDGLVFHSPTVFRVFGRRFDTEEIGGSVVDGSILTEDARSRLEAALYAILHCREPIDVAPSARYDDWLGARAFSDQLAAANTGAGTWQAGWLARGVDPDGRVVVEKYGVRFWARPEGVRTVSSEPGSGVMVRVGREYRHIAPGFYMVLGNADDNMDWRGTVRLYWHLTPGIASWMVENLTKTLNDGGVPFRFKLLDDPQSYHRADAAVLYLGADSYPVAVPLLRPIYEDVAPQLRPAVSLFVKRLAPGLGVAEDPGEVDTSYGQQRCRVLASVLTSTTFFQAASTAARLEVALEGLRAAGVDPEAVYLRPGSRDQYEPFVPVPA
jgi:type III HopA1-like effector protein